MSNHRNYDWSDWPQPRGIKDIKEADRNREFEDFKDRFNDRRDTSAQPVFTLILLKELLKHPAPQVLDIGCGHGIGTRTEYQALLSSLSGEYSGVEPDKDVKIDPGVVQKVYRCLLEDADLPENSYDLVFAMFVVEHVADPVGFFRAIRRSLKPGAQCYFLTTNGSSFFTLVAKWLKRLKLIEAVHTVLRRAQSLEVEHYPVVYRLNKPRQIARAAAEAGLCEPEFAYFQLDGTNRYMPGPFKIIYQLLMAIRRLRGNPRCLDTLVCRVRKPEQA